NRVFTTKRCAGIEHPSAWKNAQHSSPATREAALLTPPPIEFSPPNDVRELNTHRPGRMRSILHQQTMCGN
ncbi:MAG: hypothetical protein LBR61_11890, partial [Synergistaceae bacterium]|nr:hypothetical protein [Synergistaceae bacterium]